MMAATSIAWHQISARGRLTASAPLIRFTWFRTGGPADWLFEPADRDDLAALLRRLPCDVPVTVLGTGSNVLVRDGGVDGLVIRLGKPFQSIQVDGTVIAAGAGASDPALAHAAAGAGLSGLEFLRGVPGTVGGAVAMNAGAYGQEVADTLIDADLMLPDGRVETWSAAAFGFGYRTARLPDGALVLAARFRGRPDDPDKIRGRMAAIGLEREASQPVRARTGGSTFKNPPGQKAWQLIDQAGCRGLTCGPARVSDQHCNFLIAEDGARAADIEALGEQVRAAVQRATGITLAWELRRIGRRTAP